MPSQVHADPTQDVETASDATTPRVDLLEVMQEMTVPERRRVYALQALLQDYHVLRAQMRTEIAQLAKESAAASAKIFEARKAIVSGARDITPEEMQRPGVEPTSSTPAPATKTPAKPPGKKGVKVVDPVDQKQNSELEKAAGSATGGIPNFWLTAMGNSEALNSLITEKDRDALSHLVDIEKTFIDADPEKGDRLVFRFTPNPYFSNATLTKEYHTEYDEDHGEMRIADVVGCTIDWKSPKKNLTIVVKQKKQRNKKSGEMRVVEREEPCESFFNFFSPPTQKEEDEEDEEDDFFEQEMEMDVEAGTALMEAVVPRAIFFYTGESVVEMGKELRDQFGFGDEEDEEGDDEEEESEEDDDDEDAAPAGGSNFRNIVRQRGGGAGGAGRGRGGAGGAPQPQQECKQQ